MNLRKTCPDIPDDWKGGITDACRILGEGKPISDKTLRKHLGSIRVTRRANGRIQLTGREVKRLWALL